MFNLQIQKLKDGKFLLRMIHVEQNKIVQYEYIVEREQMENLSSEIKNQLSSTNIIQMPNQTYQNDGE